MPRVRAVAWGRWVRARVARIDARVRAHPLWGEVYAFLDGCVGDFVRDHGPIYAAAIAFFAILSLVPLVVLFASAGSYALWHVGGGEVGADAMLVELNERLRRAIPYLSADFLGDVREVVRVREELGLIGTVALLGTASQVFRALEYAFARVFSGVPAAAGPASAEPRNFVLSKLLFGAFVVALFTAFAVLRFAWGILRSALAGSPELARWLDGLLREGTPGGFALDAVLVVGGFVVLLKAFTQKRVESRFALCGGLGFLVLFAVARGLYDAYLTHVARLGAVYGSLAALMTVVLWFFYLSLILLLCAYGTRTLQQRFRGGRAALPSSRRPRVAP